MTDHYIIVADHGHLRIFRQQQSLEQMTPGLAEVQAMDFPHGIKSYVEGEADGAGRFQGSKQQGRGPGAPTARMGMSIDERLPMQREEERRRIRDVAVRVDTFLQNYPDSTWDFAAGPSVHNAVIEELSPQVKTRLRRSISKDLVHQPVAELLSHFANAK